MDLNLNVKLENVCDFESYNAKEKITIFFMKILRGDDGKFSSEELFCSVEYAYELISLTIDAGEEIVIKFDDEHPGFAIESSGIDAERYYSIFLKIRQLIKECYIESLKMYGVYLLGARLISELKKKGDC